VVYTYMAGFLGKWRSMRSPHKVLEHEPALQSGD
jgi:hypothetical protein